MDLIEELRKVKINKNSTNGKVVFLNNIDQIRIALNHGYKVIDIWRLMHDRGEIKVQYNQFSMYVRQFIKGSDKC